MAKKKKMKKVRNQRHKVASLGTLSPEEQLEKGTLFLQQEKYRDAILCFKQLFKQDENPEVLQLLELAYTGRIQNLATKSMIKEAMALLKTMAHLCPDAKIEPLQLSLFLQSGKYSESLRLYKQYQSQLESSQIQYLDRLFGALLVTGTEGIHLKDFSEDSPVALHGSVALAALSFFWNKEESKAREAVKQIPLSSPYRDLRTLLTGLLHIRQDKEKGETFLRKIGTDSPYFRFAARYLGADGSPETFLKKLATTPKRDHQKICKMHDLSNSQLRLLVDLSDFDGKPLSLQRIVHRNGRCFNLRQRTKLLRNILPFCGVNVFSLTSLSSEFSNQEKYQIEALAAEKAMEFSFSTELWDEYLTTIDLRNPIRQKEIALVMRHQVKLMQKEDYDSYGPEDILDVMLESLNYDQSHVQTWLDASEFARHNLSLAKHYSIINDAVQKLPENVSILIAAMRACGNRGAHKKASNLAKRALEIDPINTNALDFLVESRLEHGRKLASQGKWALAEKELQGADTRVKAVRLRGRNYICLGILQLLQNEKEGLQLIGHGQRENGSPLLSHILTSLESHLYQLSPTWQNKFDQQLQKLTQQTTAFDRADFLRLISWMLNFSAKQWLALKKSCSVLKKFFSKTAAMNWSRDEGLSICRALDRAELHMAFKKCSTKLLKEYPDDPEVLAWHLIAKFSQENKSHPEDLLDTIDDLISELLKISSFELVDRLEDLYNEISRSQFMDSFFEDDDDDGFFDEGPFRMPFKPKEKESQRPKIKPMRGEQLNLFDDEQ